MIRITREHNLGSFTHPRHDRLHFQGGEILRLIDHQELIGNRSTADGVDRFNLQQAHALEVGPGIAWFAVALFLRLLSILTRGGTGDEVDVVDDRLHPGPKFLLKRAGQVANVFTKGDRRTRHQQAGVMMGIGHLVQTGSDGQECFTCAGFAHQGD